MYRRSGGVFGPLPSCLDLGLVPARPAARYRPIGCQLQQRWDWAYVQQLCVRPFKFGQRGAEGGLASSISESDSTRPAMVDSPKEAFATSIRSSKCRRLRSAGSNGHAHRSGSDQKWGSICFRSASVRSEGY
jgi:hypothetical protein